MAVAFIIIIINILRKISEIAWEKVYSLLYILFISPGVWVKIQIH